MKKIVYIILIVIFIAGALIAAKIYTSNNSVENKLISGIPFLNSPKPQQYYGATVDMSQILPESPHYIKNKKGQDLIDIASSLGMNTLRITNITSINDSLTPSYTHQQWQEVLDKMRKKNMFAVVLVEANAPDIKFNRITLDDYYLNFVKNYVITQNLCDFSNILAVDIANEPILNENNLTKMKEAADMVKGYCPSMQITIGSWGTDSGQKNPDGSIVYYWHDPKEMPRLNNIVDIYSVHMYGFDKPVNGPFPEPYKFAYDYLTLARKYSNNKPIFIEEFGAGNGDELTDQNTLGSQELQNNVYISVLKVMYALKNNGVIGATGYLFYPRTDGPDSWSIAKDNANTLLPAAYAFRDFKNN